MIFLLAHGGGAPLDFDDPAKLLGSLTISFAAAAIITSAIQLAAWLLAKRKKRHH